MGLQWFTKWHLGTMRVRVASYHYCHHFPASAQRDPGVPLGFLPLSCSSSLTVSGQELCSGTVDCAQVWPARPRESIGCSGSVTRELETVGEALTGVQAVVAVGIFHLRHRAKEKLIRPRSGDRTSFHCARAHTLPTPTPHGAQAIAGSTRACVHTNAHTHHTHPPGVRRRLQGCPGSQQRIGHGSAAPPQDPVCPRPRSSTSPSPKPCPLTI